MRSKSLFLLISATIFLVACVPTLLVPIRYDNKIIAQSDLAASVDFHSGARAWPTSSYRYPGYRIKGRGFGTRAGLVTIDGEMQRAVKWMPDLIIIAMPNPSPFGTSAPPRL